MQHNKIPFNLNKFKEIENNLVLIDDKFSLKNVNLGFSDILGEVPENLEGRNLFEVLPFLSKKGINPELLTFLSERQFCHFEEFFDDPKDSKKKLRFGLFKINGKTGVILSRYHDLTGVDYYFNPTGNYLKEVFNSIGDLIVILDSELNLIWANDSVYKRCKDADKKKCFEFFKSRKKKCENCMVSQTFRDGLMHSSEEVLNFKKESSEWYHVSSFPLKDDHGNIMAVVEVLRDISERKKLEKKLKIYYDDLENRVNERTCELKKVNALLLNEIDERKKAKELLKADERNLQELVSEKTKNLNNSLERLRHTNIKLMESEKNKNQFLANITHELRTPLNGVLGFSDLLKGCYFGDLNEKQLEYVNQIESCGKHQLELINNLLDIAKSDAGKLVLQLKECKLNSLIKNIFSTMEGQFSHKKLTVSTLFDSRINYVKVDIQKIREIVMNLLSNAVKFTDAGGEITCTTELKDDFIQVCVKDSGIGIEKHEQDKLFMDFYQGDHVHSEVMGGTGIGLSLTKRLVEIHEGKIWIESEPGKGSSFFFSIPKKYISDKIQGE